MVWTIEVSPRAEKQLSRLDVAVAKRIRQYLTKVAASPSPRAFGGALRGPLDRYWRYRVGDYRIVCELYESRLVVLIVEIDHRSKVYR